MDTKILTISLSLLFLGSSYAQQNTLPQSGNVGIGTINPDSKLSVNGSVRIDSALIVKDSVRINKNLRVDQDVRFLGLAKMNDVKVLDNFVSNGLSKFNGDVKFSVLEEISNLNNKYVVVTNENGLAKKVSYDSLVNILKSGIYAPFPPGPQTLCDIAGYTNNPTWANGLNKIFSQCPQVNIGIGTDAPRVKLDVRGTTYSGQLAINADPLALGTALFRLKSTYNLNSPTYGAAPIFVIENNERTLFQINNDGIVRSREIKVNLDATWPDYVFEPSYLLQPLSEVAQFIKANGHLPNVPSAQEIEADGVSLGEMNRVLLEKVEELTLHLIEQQKLIEAQNERLEALETNTK